MVSCVLMGLLYFLPTIIAVRRGHPGGGIFLLNFFLGWTGIGWLIMFIWALTLPGPYYYAAVYYASGYAPGYYGPRYHGPYSPYYPAYNYGTLYCRTCWRRWW